MESLIEFLNFFEPYYIMLIAAVGLVGNTVSFTLFAFTKLRLKEVHSVLAALALIDNGFLLVLVLITLRHFNVNLADEYSLACKLSVFLPYLFGFLSIWLIVLFSIERFIAVYFPLKRLELSNRRRNKAVIAFLITFSVGFYSYGFWTTELQAVHSRQQICMTATRWLGLLKVMAVVDLVLTMLVPFILIFTLNLLIIIRLTRRSNAGFLVRNVKPARPPPSRRSVRRSVKHSTADVDVSVPMMARNGHGKPSLTSKDSAEEQQRRSSRRSGVDRMTSHESCATSIARSLSTKAQGVQSSKTTRILLIISTVFLVLHAPTAALKIWYVVATHLPASSVSSAAVEPPRVNSSTSSGAPETHPIEELLERVTCYIYYLHYSLNFFLYVFNIRRFRELFLPYLKKRG